MVRADGTSGSVLRLWRRNKFQPYTMNHPYGILKNGHLGNRYAMNYLCGILLVEILEPSARGIIYGWNLFPSYKKKGDVFRSKS